MAAKMMLHRWKRMVTDGNPSVINSLNIITVGGRGSSVGIATGYGQNRAIPLLFLRAFVARKKGETYLITVGVGSLAREFHGM
jgi:hypothetical protein